MFYSEWTSYIEGYTIIGFLIHEQPITYGSNWGGYNGFYISLGIVHRNKKVRPKTIILKIHGGYYINSINSCIDEKYIKFITMNQKLTPEEENIIKNGVETGRV